MSAPTRPSRLAPVAPARAMLRTVGGGTSLATTFDVRSAFDFSVSLAAEVGEHDELPEADRLWLERSRAALPASLRTPERSELCIFGAGMLVDRPEVLDATAFIDLIHTTPARELVRTVMADTLRDPARAALTNAALDGDPESIEAVVAAWSGHEHEWVGRLLREPDGIVGEMGELMAAWLPFYLEIEPRVQRIIARDAQLRTADRDTLESTELIERTTNGVRWLSEPGVRRVVLAPSYLVRPYNFTFSGGDWRMFVYPVSDQALEPADPHAPPVGVLRLHRALGDESRLRILRLLRDRDHYLTEIAEHLELSKPTIKHHLAQLRAAGLVTLTEEGGLSYYSLRRDRLGDASTELKHYLLS